MAYNYPQELVFIGKQIVSSSSTSTSFTSGISSNFTNYLIKIRNVVFTVAGTNSLTMTYSTNGGSSYLSTGYKSENWTRSGLSGDDDSSSSAFLIFDDIGTSPNIPYCGDVTCYNLSNAQVKTVYAYNSGWLNSGCVVQFHSGVQTGTTAVTAIKFQGGTFTGNFYLYGII